MFYSRLSWQFSVIPDKVLESFAESDQRDWNIYKLCVISRVLGNSEGNEETVMPSKKMCIYWIKKNFLNTCVVRTVQYVDRIWSKPRYDVAENGKQIETARELRKKEKKRKNLQGKKNTKNQQKSWTSLEDWPKHTLPSEHFLRFFLLFTSTVLFWTSPKKTRPRHHTNLPFPPQKLYTYIYKEIK